MAERSPLTTAEPSLHGVSYEEAFLSLAWRAQLTVDISSSLRPPSPILNYTWRPSSDVSVLLGGSHATGTDVTTLPSKVVHIQHGCGNQPICSAQPACDWRGELSVDNGLPPLL